MAPWAFMKVNYLPMTLGVVFSFGLVTCFVVAVLRGDVSPYMPFISETGGKYPEAGLFSIFLYLSSVLGLSTMFTRFLIVDELNRGIDRTIDILNRSSVVIGFIALMGMVVVAAYPMTSIPTAHGIGANVLFLGGVIYAALQTWLSYKMSPYYNGTKICHIRLTITVFTAIALIVMSVIMPLGMSIWSTTKHSHWTGGKMPGEEYSFIIALVLAVGPKAISEWISEPHNHWTGSKMPQEKGFGLMVVSSVAEWTMAIMFLAYYFTFIREFQKVCMHLRVQMLVQHFDEEPHEVNVAVATERTPIVM
ncbi:DNA damage-regulated autophagy modulator like protein [Argiope bruennichi]|uniref:DNA damage-regulated autophagy modulator like protein n=1 Tax=Argiope bruennichi TaxID=94029 RepID=A0A8T0FKZ8_ARGBR|nr:DNA damage-regulated autophagy modulator like protein [Argiope bruennichi]